MNDIKIVEYTGDCDERLYLLRENGTSRVYGPYYLRADAERMRRYFGEVSSRPYGKALSNCIARFVVGAVLASLASWLLGVSTHEYSVGLVVALFVIVAKL